MGRKRRKKLGEMRRFSAPGYPTIPTISPLFMELWRAEKSSSDSPDILELGEIQGKYGR